MPFFPETRCEILDEDAIPATSLETELNYRTRPLSSEQELRLVMLVLFGPLPILIVSSLIVNQMISLDSFFKKLYFALFLLTLLLWGIAKVLGKSIVRLSIAVVFLSSAYLVGRLWAWSDALQISSLGWVVAVAAVVLVTHNIAHWILVGPTVDLDRMQLWKYNLPGFIPRGFSFECPELLTYNLSFFLLPLGVYLANLTTVTLYDSPRLWPLAFVMALILLQFTMHLVCRPLVPPHDWKKSWQAAFRAWIVFLTYDIHNTKAAGVFRFPTVWLRSIIHRWMLIVAALQAITFSIFATLPSPFERWREGFFLTGELGLNLVVMTIGAPALLITILWFVGGPILLRFESELAKPAPERTDWDNYVERIANSRDSLEREHFLMGFTIQGDCPVLLHRDVLDQHGHLTGDSGASKSSLGISPLVTQLIARGDVSVVIVDLKGDKALLETCRLEAARTRKLRFRWLSNEVGKTTFAFNPFIQSHNRMMSVEQFTQYLLKGLSLDFGVAYGASYFTAMNATVLATTLANCKAKSFRQLAKAIDNKEWYGRFGEKDDWEKARHLIALVRSLADMEFLNVEPESYSDRPDVLARALDATNIIEEPQVVYISLKSAIEPANTASVARLFLWTLFNSGAFQPQGRHRAYIFVDEFQQIISEGISLPFEQFRDLGGTLIAAHQTVAQLNRNGVDLTETVDSCTALKQVFRASGLQSAERIEKQSGTKRVPVATWSQRQETWLGNLWTPLSPRYAEEGTVHVSEEERPRLDRNELMRISSNKLASVVRFTLGSGYTQFAGATVPIVSQFPVTYGTYLDRRKLNWPTDKGTFVVQPYAPM